MTKTHFELVADVKELKEQIEQLQREPKRKSLNQLEAKRILDEMTELAKNISMSEKGFTDIRKNTREDMKWLRRNRNIEFEVKDAKLQAIIERNLGFLEGQLMRFKSLRDRLGLINDMIKRLS